MNFREYTISLSEIFYQNKNYKIAKSQEAYMRNQFPFLGITSTIRKELQKPFLKKNTLPPKNNLSDIVYILWKKPEREFHYFAQDLVRRYTKEYCIEDIELFEFMATNNSWWDTVDIIAPNIMGSYFKLYYKKREKYIFKWLESENIWLQRCAILFQLRYKEELDTKLLSNIILYLNSSNEFFIQKAIGWILREYSKTNSKWVLEFVDKNSLATLSKKEAFRIIKRGRT
jgi:3-methyladenine DNA glycosylase AlkD